MAAAASSTPPSRFLPLAQGQRIAARVDGVFTSKERMGMLLGRAHDEVDVAVGQDVDGGAAFLEYGHLAMQRRSGDTQPARRNREPCDVVTRVMAQTSNALRSAGSPAER